MLWLLDRRNFKMAHADETAEHFQTGAVWLARRPGSRAGNRIVIRCGKGPRVSGSYLGESDGVYYRVGGRTAWCTFTAWNRWVKKQGGEFVLISSDHVNLTC